MKRIALRHSRAGGIAVGAADFEVLEDPVRIRPLRPTRTGKGRERGHSPLAIYTNATLSYSYWAGFLGIVGLALPSTLMTSCGL